MEASKPPESSPALAERAKARVERAESRAKADPRIMFAAEVLGSSGMGLRFSCLLNIGNPPARRKRESLSRLFS